ncbi:unnamed protein product [Parajaminaea phylloscopi]
MTPPRPPLPALVGALWAGLGGLLFGWDTGVIGGLIQMQSFARVFGRYYDNVPSNPTTEPAKPGWAVSTRDRSLVVSVLSIGTFVGALSAAPLGDAVGRRMGFIIAIFVFTLGIIVQCTADHVPAFAIGRVLAGLGVGVISALCPLYQSETSPRAIRGAVVTFYQLSIGIGMFLANCVNEATQHRVGRSGFIIPIAIQFALAGVLLAGLVMLPESPRYRVRQGRLDDAAAILAKLNATTPDDAVVKAELAEITQSLGDEDGTWAQCFRPPQRKRVVTGIAAQILQQFSGINYIAYYGPTFFASTGAKNPFLFSVAANVVGLASTVAGMWLTEAAGRRAVLFWGAVWMFVTQLIVASVGTASTLANVPAQRACVAFVCLYVGGFAATWGPAIWVTTSELYPLSIRAKGMAASTAANWLLNFAIGFATPYLVDSGPGNAGLGTRVFFIWSAFCAVAGVFAWFFIYETSGLSLEEIDQLYEAADGLESVVRNHEIKRLRGGPTHKDASEPAK